MKKDLQLAISRVKNLASIPFVRGVTIFQMGTIANMALGVLSSVAYTRMLGLHAFGALGIINALAGLISIVMLYGQDTATTTFLAEAAGKKDQSEIMRVLRYFLQASCLSGIVMTTLLLACPTLATLSGNTPETGHLARLVLLNIFLQAPNALTFAVLQIERRIGTIIIVENIIDALQIFLSVTLILCGYGVKGLLFGTLIGSLLSLPALFFLYENSARRQGFPPLTSVIMHASRRDTADLFRQGMWMTLDRNISGNLYPNIFYMLLGAYGSVESVGIFRLAIKFATLPSSLVMPSIARMSSTTIPKLVAKNIHTAVRESTKILFTTVTLITLVTIGSCLAMPFLIPLVYGQSFAAASTIFFFLSPINIITGSHVISVPFLRVLRRVWIITYVHLAGILLAIAAFFLLKDWIGAVSATIASILIFHLNSLWLFAYLYYKIGNPFTRAKRS